MKPNDTEESPFFDLIMERHDWGTGETRLSRDERGAGRFLVKLVNSTTNSNKGLALLECLTLMETAPN